jgi:hypothetical protein
MFFFQVDPQDIVTVCLTFFLMFTFLKFDCKLIMWHILPRLHSVKLILVLFNV